MPKMSASAQQSTMTVGVGVGASAANTPASQQAAPRAVPTADADADPTAIPSPKPAGAPGQWRMVIAGYIILALGSLLAFLIPHFHLHAGLGEESLVILSIAGTKFERITR